MIEEESDADVDIFLDSIDIKQVSEYVNLSNNAPDYCTI